MLLAFRSPAGRTSQGEASDVALARNLGSTYSMAFHREIAAVVLFALASVTATAGTEEKFQEARVEATIPQVGFVMSIGSG